jgi:hypothetical protein
MADSFLNNNGAYSLLQAAYEQVLGEDAIATEDLSAFVDKGAAYNTLIANNAWKDQFTKALLNQCVKTFYLDTSYREEYKDPFYQDSRRFGAIVQMVSAEAPEVQASHAWQNFVSGTSTVGTYTIFMPQVSTAFMGKSTSWELPIAITDEQWDTAFKSEAELEEFVAFIFMTVDNAIVSYLETASDMNRNNFIGEKIAYAASVGATGVHVVDLLAAYIAETGDRSITTKEGFMADDKCMRFAAETVDKYVGYLSKMSELFNIEGKKKFCPKSRMVCQILQHFYSRMKTVSYADAYNLDFVKLNGFDAVPYWQGFGHDANGLVDFDEISAIKVKTASGDTVSQTGVVGFLADQYAIMHTILQQRTAVTRHDPEALTQYYHQFRDQRINNLGQNAVVFVINDVAAGE